MHFTFKGESSLDYNITLLNTPEERTSDYRYYEDIVEGVDGGYIRTEGFTSTVFKINMAIEGDESQVIKVLGWLKGRGEFSHSIKPNKFIQVDIQSEVEFNYKHENLYTGRVVFYAHGALWYDKDVKQVVGENKTYNELLSKEAKEFKTPPWTKYNGAPIETMPVPKEVFDEGYTRNLVTNSNFVFGTTSWLWHGAMNNNDMKVTDGVLSMALRGQNSGTYRRLSRNIGSYTITIKHRYLKQKPIRCRFQWGGMSTPYYSFGEEGEWVIERNVVTFMNAVTNDPYYFYSQADGTITKAEWEIAWIKIEKGNNPNPTWTPAWEDLPLEDKPATWVYNDTKNYLDGGELLDKPIGVGQSQLLTPNTMPAGSYTVSVESIDQVLNTNGMTRALVLVYNGNTAVSVGNIHFDLTQSQPISFTAPEPFNNLRFYAGNSHQNSTPNHFIFHKLKLEKGRGTSPIKYLTSVGISKVNAKYKSRLKVRNIGTKRFRVDVNVEGKFEWVNPNTYKNIEIYSTGNGTTTKQLQFRTENVDDEINAIASDPSIGEIDTTIFDGEMYNDGNIYSKPLLHLTKKDSNLADVIIMSEEDLNSPTNKVVRFQYEFMHGDTDVYIDCETQEAYTLTNGIKRDKLQYLTIGADFPILQVGTNYVKSNVDIEYTRGNRYL